MNKSKKIIMLSICILAMLLIIVVFKSGTNSSKSNIGNAKSVKTVLGELEDDIKLAESGKYTNLKVKELNVNLDNINKLYQIDIIENYDYKNNSYKENIEIVQSIADKFFGVSVDLSGAMVDGISSRTSEEEYTFEKFREDAEKDNISGDGYFLIFKDNRENGGKGFVQIDASLDRIWFSKGELESTSPMYGYETKKVYNFTLNEENLEDKIKLKDGEISIGDAKKFVEDYLNNSLPYEKNNDFEYEVAEIRVLDVEGQDAIGACVRKKYNGIAFDYVDGVTEGIYNSDFWDDRGELCMAKTNEIDNMCGLGGDTYFIEQNKKEIKQIYSLGDAFEIISKSIGENSVYDVYGAEIIYQFTPVEESDGSIKKCTGRLKWKVVARNENDDKDTWFYVDVETGELSHRFKKIYGE